MVRKKLGDLVVERGQVTREQIDTALSYQRATGKPLGEVLLLLGIISEDHLRASLAAQQSVEPWDLRASPPESEALQLIPVDICVKHRVVPVRVENGMITVAMQKPGDLAVVDVLHATTRLRINPVQASDGQLTATLREVFGHHAGPESQYESFVSKALADVDDKRPGESDEVTEEETRPVIGMVNQIIFEAAEMRASDIHIEPGAFEADVRYRIDGRLLKVRQIPGSLVRMVVARIKIMAELDIACHRLPQDGRVEVSGEFRSLDLRISILPTQYGQRVVIRLLDRGTALKGFDNLGLRNSNADILRELVSKPYGIVIVTGPTGSGKTTTLYSALNELKDEGTNIMTCEDPIEYELQGINQSQVHEKAGLTFARQLRAILRQDPDVILVGEIRDRETAETAVRAALTGHMVLTTLHSNDAASAIPRLIDMGVEPFLLGSSLVGIVAQRLIRMLCPHCKTERKPTKPEIELLESFGYKAPAKLPAPAGCPECHGTGYYGRQGVHEVLPVTEQISELIGARATTDALRAAAEPVGYRPIYLDALDRAVAGDTSLEEIRRVVFLDTFSARHKAGLKLAG